MFAKWPMPAWEPIQRKPAARYRAVDVNPGGKKERVGLARVRLALLNGWAAESARTQAAQIINKRCRSKCAGQHYGQPVSVKASGNEIIVVDGFSLEEPKTRLMVQALDKLVGDASVLILIPEKSPDYDLVTGRLTTCQMPRRLLASYLNIRDLLGLRQAGDAAESIGCDWYPYFGLVWRKMSTIYDVLRRP
jgi:hypothetical protein